MYLSKISFYTILLFVTFFAVPNTNAAERPKLVVFIAIDQLRADYLTRFREFLLPPVQKNGLPGGFRYFTDKGAFYPTAETGHGTNVTAPGHATLSTGALPYTHGIVANRWFDSETNQVVYGLEDHNSKVLTQTDAPKEKGRSPKNLLSTTISDEIKTAFGGKSIVGTVAIKDRAAILMGGHRADYALWFDDKIRGLTTSSYYSKEMKLPQWVEQWNKTNWIDKNVPLAWERMLPRGAYAFSTQAPTKNVYQNYKGLGQEFPHQIEKGGVAFQGTPWGSAYVLEAALEMASKTGMGKDEITDFLGVGISSFDIAGHAFGANSEQMQDFFIRQDRLLASFLKKLQHTVPGGLASITFVLTADHGVTEIPSIAQSVGMPFKAMAPEDFYAKAESFLEKEFGLNRKNKPVAYISENNLYLNTKELVVNKLDPEVVAQKLARWLATQPCFGMAYTKWELLAGKHANLHFSKRVATSTNEVRSGDVVYSTTGICPQYEHYGVQGAEHGHSYTHDASVPIMIVGKSFKPGRYFQKATLADIAPTIAASVGVSPTTGSEGRVLAEIIR